MKKPVTGWHNRLTEYGVFWTITCSQFSAYPFICVFQTKPTFIVKGLYKDAVMDTQFKFAEHTQGTFNQGSEDTRAYVGPKGWIISRNTTDKKWRMSHYHYTDVILHTKLPSLKWPRYETLCNSTLW